MRLKLFSLFSIFQVCTLIGRSFSSVCLSFSKNSLDLTEDYIRLKESNRHRGLFLALSDVQIHEICQDFYSPQLYANPVKETSTDGSKIPRSTLLMQEITINGRPSLGEWSLVIMCTTSKFKNRAPRSTFHYLTSAHRSKWLYRTKIPNADPTRHDLFMKNFVALSPDYVSSLEKSQVERWYLNTLQTMTALSKESPTYIDQIKQKDTLYRLSKKQRLILCASVLSSPIYQQDNLEMSLEWINETDETQGTVNFEERLVSFGNVGNTQVEQEIECFLCKAFENGMNINSESTNLYIAPTFEDEFSVMVLKEQKDGIIYPDKYFKNIALLITAHEEMSYNELFLNFRT